MRKFIRTFVDMYVLVKVTPMVVKGVIVLLEASMTGFDNSIEVLRQSRKDKKSKEEKI